MKFFMFSINDILIVITCFIVVSSQQDVSENLISNSTIESLCNEENGCNSTETTTVISEILTSNVSDEISTRTVFTTDQPICSGNECQTEPSSPETESTNITFSSNFSINYDDIQQNATTEATTTELLNVSESIKKYEESTISTTAMPDSETMIIMVFNSSELHTSNEIVASTESLLVNDSITSPPENNEINNSSTYDSSSVTIQNDSTSIDSIDINNRTTTAINSSEINFGNDFTTDTSIETITNDSTNYVLNHTLTETFIENINTTVFILPDNNTVEPETTVNETSVTDPELFIKNLTTELITVTELYENSTSETLFNQTEMTYIKTDENNTNEPNSTIETTNITIVPDYNSTDSTAIISDYNSTTDSTTIISDYNSTTDSIAIVPDYNSTTDSTAMVTDYNSTTDSTTITPDHNSTTDSTEVNNITIFTIHNLPTVTPHRNYLTVEIKINCSDNERQEEISSSIAEFLNTTLKDPTDCTILRNITIIVPNEIVDFYKISQFLTEKFNTVQLVRIWYNSRDNNNTHDTVTVADDVTEREVILYVSLGVCLGIVLLLAVIITCFKCLRKRSNKPLDLDVPHLNLRLEDYTLTRIPRPNTIYLDYFRGPIINDRYSSAPLSNSVSAANSERGLVQPFDTSVIPLEDAKKLEDLSTPITRNETTCPSTPLRTFGRKDWKNGENLIYENIMSSSTEKLHSDFFKSGNRGEDNPTFAA